MSGGYDTKVVPGFQDAIAAKGRILITIERNFYT